MSQRRGAEGAEEENQTSEWVIGAAIKGVVIQKAFRVDRVVEDLVFVELKALDTLSEIHQVRLLTYLRLANKRLGLVINFNTPVLWRGVRRVVNNL